MSLVNLAHVCSHLQNASLARLGLTSIPYSRLHLQLSVLLHKQGFLQQVKLGGPSPPASAFPATLSDNHHITSAPHRDRSPRSGEAALHDVVYNGKSVEELAGMGYGDEARVFAWEHSQLTKAQLEKDGWDAKAVDFVLAHSGKSKQEMEAEDFDAQAVQIIERYNIHEHAMAQLREQLAHENRLRESQGEDVQVLEQDLSQHHIEQRLRAILRKQGFDQQSLRYFAGSAGQATPRHLQQDGITVSAMGLEVANQPITTIPAEYRDPWQLEEEGVVTQANRASRRLWLGMKYWDGIPVLRKARMLSKPTKRIWLNSSELGKVVRGSNAGEIKGMGQVGEVMAVSTDRGVMEARECVERRIGGMVLCRIW
ncbi:hypothetical protein LTR36_002764 [Oleoguttula mirabilis]|uniref:Ribosomal protein S8 n=1 Tax=Oleoguttula mirabilis TaxID=1507867 RepID=A0AAV9JJ36_9PEZI|nr:hypothetical protein LTR36_002764 [Oleoguttula mirabilis]